MCIRLHHINSGVCVRGICVCVWEAGVGRDLATVHGRVSINTRQSELRSVQFCLHTWLQSEVHRVTQEQLTFIHVTMHPVGKQFRMDKLWLAGLMYRQMQIILEQLLLRINAYMQCCYTNICIECTCAQIHNSIQTMLLRTRMCTFTNLTSAQPSIHACTFTILWITISTMSKIDSTFALLLATTGPLECVECSWNYKGIKASRLIHGQISDDKPVGFGGPRPDMEICNCVTSTFCSCRVPASRLCLFSTLSFFLCGIVFDRMQSFTLSIQGKVVSCQILFNTFKILVVFSGGFIQTKPMQLVRQKSYKKKNMKT